MNSLFFRDISELDRLEFLTNPIAGIAILDMHELDTDLTAICLFVSVEEITEHPLLLSLDDGASERHDDVEFTVHIGLGEAVGGRVQQVEKGLIREVHLLCETWHILVDFFQVERIDIRNEMTMCHVCAEQDLDAN